MMLAISAARGYHLRQLDVSSAYLQADIAEELYMERPCGYDVGDDSKVLWLKKSIYGLK